MWTSLAGHCFPITGSETLGAAASGPDLITGLLMEGGGFRPSPGESCGNLWGTGCAAGRRPLFSQLHILSQPVLGVCI